MNWIDKTQMSCLPSLLKVFKPNVVGIFRIIQILSDHIQNLFNDSATCLTNKFLMNRFYRSIKYEKFLVSQPRLFQGNKRFFWSFCEIPKTVEYLFQESHLHVV